MKILITGASGFIGQYLIKELSAEHEVLGLYLNGKLPRGNFKKARINLTEQDKLQEAVLEFAPDVLFHLAAISKPAVAESLPLETVRKINVDATRTLAETCEKIGAKMIFFSTDLVYDGEGKPFKKESEPLKPRSIYAKSKADAEREVKSVFDNYVILRIALHFGFGLNGTSSHFQEMFRSLEKKKPVKLFSDQYRTQLEVNESARMLEKLLRANVNATTLNFGGKERVSRYELGLMLSEICGFDKNLIEPILAEEILGKNNVKDVSLDVSKLAEVGIEARPLEETLYEICKNRK
jgi:dTDP-4-dehydrorhamnose reductase